MARSGAVWGIIAQVSQQVLSILATFVLARLLTPSDFGVVAAAISLLQFAQLLSTMGWGLAILRRPEVDQAYLSSVFWFICIQAAVVSLGVVLAAPLLSRLIGLPDVAPYLAVLSLSAVPMAVQQVPSSILARQLRLIAMHLSSTISVVVYVGVQLLLAVLGAGAWAVIIGMVAQPVVGLVSGCIIAHWWPRLIFRRDLIKADFNLAGNMLVYNGLNYGVRNFDYWVVGHLLGAAALGAYYVAYVLPQILRLRMTWVVSAVLFPILARTGADREQTQRIYAHSLMLSIWIGVPAMTGLALLAEPVVRVFFGEQWENAVAPLRWLTFVAAIEFLTFGPPAVAQIQGKMRRLLATNVVRFVLLVTAVISSGIAFRSLSAVAGGVLFASAIFAIYQQFALARPLGLSLSPLRWDIAAIICLTIVMALVVGAVQNQIKSAPDAVQLVICTLVGAAVYFVLGRLLFSRVTTPLMHSVLRGLHTFPRRAVSNG